MISVPGGTGRALRTLQTPAKLKIQYERIDVFLIHGQYLNQSISPVRGPLCALSVSGLLYIKRYLENDSNTWVEDIYDVISRLWVEWTIIVIVGGS